MALPISFKRSLTLAIDNLFRNKFLTLATILIMALILFIFNIIFSVNILAEQAIEKLEEKVDLILYIDDDADTLVVNQLIDELEAFPETLSIIYTSKEEALESLLDKYEEEINPFTAYDLENPLPASIQIITKTPEDHKILFAYLEQSNYSTLLLDIESNAENEQIVQNLTQVTEFSEKLLFGIILTFAFGSIMIIANSIHITIFNRKKEIQIMRLVGSNLNFIRSPFIIEGAAYALLSVIISLFLFITFTEALNFSEISFLNGEIHYAKLFLLQLGASLILGTMSSLTAINHYLKKEAV